MEAETCYSNTLGISSEEVLDPIIERLSDLMVCITLKI
jgi:hypothetical protein